MGVPTFLNAPPTTSAGAATEEVEITLAKRKQDNPYYLLQIEVGVNREGCEGSVSLDMFGNTSTVIAAGRCVPTRPDTAGRNIMWKGRFPFYGNLRGRIWGSQTGDLVSMNAIVEV